MKTPIPMFHPGDLAGHRPYLLKFALLQVRRKEVAEDIVQDVLMAAMKGAAGFSGKGLPPLKPTRIDSSRQRTELRSRQEQMSCAPLASSLTGLAIRRRGDMAR
jgi:RNA polymerase sigma-70 factor (ECF subfamily)